MANTFGYNPYPEFNIRGDSANGQTGSMQPGAVTNQVDQSKPNGGGNAYADILKYINGGNQVMAGGAPQRGTTPPRPFSYNPGKDLYQFQFGNTVPTGPGQEPPDPTAQLPQPAQGGVGGPLGPDAGLQQTPTPGQTRAPFQPQNAAPTGGDKNATMTNADAPIGDYGAPPTGVSQDAWNLANTWAQKYPAYAWVAKNPNIVERYLQDALMWAQNGATGIQFADWLHSNAPNYQNPDYTKAAGYDTYLYASAEDAAAGKMRQRTNTPPPPQGGQQPPYVPPSQGNDRGPQPVMDDKGNILGYTYHSFSTSVTSPYTDARPLFDVTGKNVLGWMRENGQFIPNTTAPSGQPGTQPQPPDQGQQGQQQPPGNQANVPPPGIPGGTPGPQGEGGSGGSGGSSGGDSATPPEWNIIGGNENQLDVGSLINTVTGMYNPQFAQQRDDFRRAMNANAALTGDINSGGYQSTYGRELSRLMAGQGEQLAGATENALNRASDIYKANLAATGQKYSIDAQMFATQLQDATQRFQITTNDQLQRFLDSQDNELKKYGIDKNDLLERYKQELQLQGIQYSADAQVRAASLQAAAQKAAASAQANASKYNADIQRQIAGDNYNLNLADLSWQQYVHDNPSVLDMLKLYAGMSPEQMALLGINQIPWQNWYAKP